MSANAATATENFISRNEIAAALQSGESMTLVEALPENFYDAGHLPGALAIPVGYAADLAPRLIPEKKAAVVVYCSSSICQNSVLVAEELKALGYTNVRRYVEGKEDWKKAGLPLEGERKEAVA